jgi:hypothetical protein
MLMATWLQHGAASARRIDFANASKMRTWDRGTAS